MGNLRIDIRDKRLPGGRLNISARTTSRKQRDQWAASIDKLLDRDELAVIELLRARKIHPSEIDAAVRDGDYKRLRDRSAFTAGNLGDAVDAYVKVVRDTREERTFKHVRHQSDALLRVMGRGKALESVTTEEGQAFLASPGVEGGPWAALAQRQARGLYARIWAHAKARSNPWATVQLPKARKKRHVFLRPEQWKLLFDACLGTPWLTSAALGCLAGLRVGEVCHLRLIDVDLEQKVIRISPRAGSHPWKPKTDNSVRDVPLGDELHSLILLHIASGFAGDTYLLRLHDRVDGPVDIQVMGDYFARSCKAAGIEYGRDTSGVTFHTCRHTFASWLCQRDVQLLKIARLLGDSVEVVASCYAHLLPQDLERAVHVIDDVVRHAAD